MTISTKELPREDWLAARRRGIGGSDAAAIVGLNPYVSAFQVYCDKLNLLPQQEENEAMRQGKDFEDYVSKRFEEAAGLKVRRDNYMRIHPKYDFMLANIDRMIVGEKAGLECKTTSVYNKTDFSSGDVPPQYYIQCIHYMMVTGFATWYMAVLVLNKGFHWFKIEKTEQVAADIAALEAAEIAFWQNNVLKQIPPEPDGTERAAEVIQKLYPRADAEQIALYHKEKEIAELLKVKVEIKRLEETKTELENIIKAEMKTAEIGFCNGYAVTWKNSSRETLDGKALKAAMPEVHSQFSKTTETRIFTAKEAKEAI